MKLLMESVRSFRPIARNETLFANPVQISYIQADGQNHLRRPGATDTTP